MTSPASSPQTVSIIVPSLDGLTDDVREQLRREVPELWEKIIITGVTPAARARNHGAAQASGDVLLFIDDDVRFNTPGTLGRVVRLLQALDTRDAVSVTWRVGPDATWFQRRQAKEYRPEPAAPSHAAVMPWQECGTACFAIRADVFRELGGFDENLVSGEDCELAYRIVQNGGTIWTLPDNWVEHLPPADWRAALGKCWWHERGNAQVARKHPGAGYRMALDRPWKPWAYLALRSVLLIPLMFARMNYHHRRPVPAFRPVESILSYAGAWAYVMEWLRPTRPRHTGLIPESGPAAARTEYEQPEI